MRIITAVNANMNQTIRTVAKEKSAIVSCRCSRNRSNRSVVCASKISRKTSLEIESLEIPAIQCRHAKSFNMADEPQRKFRRSVTQICDAEMNGHRLLLLTQRQCVSDYTKMPFEFGLTLVAICLLYIDCVVSDLAIL